jgi:DNA-binding beta-propeller fold protein YncE
MRRKRGALLATAALALAGLSAAPAASAAEADHPLRGAITGERINGQKGEQFIDACGVATDSAGNTYVADYYKNRVVVFNKKLEYLTQIANVDPLGPAGVAPIDGPCDLAVDSSGHLYVNDYHQDVVRYTPSAYPPGGGTSYGSKLVIDDAHSTGVTVDPKTDNVYVDDRTYVAAYDSSGAPVMQGGEPLRIGEGSLKDSYSVAISSFPATEGWIYVADAATETVKVFDPALDLETPQFEIHGEGTTEGHFYLTDTDLAVDPTDGHLYLANDLEPHFEFGPEAVVDEFSAAGHYRGPVPRNFADGIPSFLQAAEPTGLAISPSDELLITSGNYENAAVFIFGPPAPLTTQILTLTKTGTGQGSVSSIPGGIGCGAVCEGEFNQGTNVVLKATPAPGSVFVAWSGCEEEPGPGRCALRMGADHTVTAEFGPAPQAAAVASSASSAAVTSTALAQSEPAAAVAPATHPRRAAKRHRRHRHAHPNRKASR